MKILLTISLLASLCGSLLGATWTLEPTAVQPLVDGALELGQGCLRFLETTLRNVASPESWERAFSTPARFEVNPR